MQAANEQSAALARLLVIVENYPQLRSNETFNRLMDELAGTENRIAVERMRYNERVQEYNTSRRQFPSNITASIFGFGEYPVFNAPPEAERVPTRDFRPAAVVDPNTTTHDMIDALLPEFDHEMTTTRKVLERVPDDSSAGSRTRNRFRSANWPHTSPRFRRGAPRPSTKSEFDIGDLRRRVAVPSQADVLAAFDRARGAARAALVGRSDADSWRSGR